MGKCRLVGRIPSPGVGRCRRVLRARRLHKRGMVTGVLDERQTGCRFRQMGDSRFGPMAPQAVAAGRVPPFVRSGGLRPWTRYAALAFTAALIASWRAPTTPHRCEARPSGSGPRAPASRAGDRPPRALRARDAARRRRGPAGGAEEQAGAPRGRGVVRPASAGGRAQQPRAAERGLARRLQTLYVEGEVDPLAVPRRRIARRRAHGPRRARPCRRPGRLDPQPGTASAASSAVPGR